MDKYSKAQEREETMEEIKQEWLSPDQAAAIFGVEKDYIMRRLRDPNHPRAIPHTLEPGATPQGNRYHINREKFTAWIEENAR